MDKKQKLEERNKFGCFDESTPIQDIIVTDGREFLYWRYKEINTPLQDLIEYTVTGGRGFGDSLSPESCSKLQEFVDKIFLLDDMFALMDSDLPNSKKWSIFETFFRKGDQGGW